MSKNMSCQAGGGAVYGIGFVGALVYFLQQAASFGEGLVGVVKAVFWPGVLVYELFVSLGL